ncbi:tyrosine-protein phosphatase [Isosphaeraceae bacterium EP7]
MTDRPTSLFRVRVRRAALALFVAVSPPSGYFAYRMFTGNLAVVEPGRIYRSAQMNAGQLTATIRDQGIRTVINLRGRNPSNSWYNQELDATLKARATHVDLPMASDQWLARSQIRTLVETLDTSEYPILIHCQFGAERTGLVSAYSVLLRPGGTMEEARGQFSAAYLFLPIKDGATMIAQLDAYASWLGNQKIAHAPEHFRRWLADEYRPGSPSREFWPYDPYPLRVVIWPEGAGPYAKTAGVNPAARVR